MIVELFKVGSSDSILPKSLVCKAWPF